MDKSKKTQILILSLITALVFMTPFFSSSSRPTYLYFIINLLIIALGAEAGLLSSPSKPPIEDKKPLINNVEQPKPLNNNIASETPLEYCSEKKPKLIEKYASEKIVGAQKVHKVKKSPSTPSLFFIGSWETEAEETIVKDFEEDEEGQEEPEIEGISGQELFTKAETFIGNFYKQLKMQREESWKKIHGLITTPFD